MLLSEACKLGIVGRECSPGLYFSKDLTRCDTLGAALIQMGVTEYSSVNSAKEILCELFPILQINIQDIPLWSHINKLEVELCRQREIDPRLKCIEYIQLIEHRTGQVQVHNNTDKKDEETNN